MPTVRIAVDPEVARLHGPEVAWTWRTLLTGCGYSWRQVAIGEPCDLAYVTDLHAVPAKVVVRADPNRWANPTAASIAGLGCDGDLSWLRFDDEVDPAPPVRHSDGRIVCDRDLAFDVFWIAAGLQEPRWPRTAHGFFDLDDSPMVTDGVLCRAVASSIGKAFETWLADATATPPEPRWPAGRRLAACCGHDVDYPEAVQGIEQVRLAARLGLAGVRAGWDLLTGARHHWHFQSWAELEAAVGLRSAFYFVARRGSLVERARGTPDPFYDIESPRFRALFERLRDQGIEIGLHASYRACERPETIAREKARLERASGGPVHGNRHHYWRLCPDDPADTLRCHERAGLVYDCSLAHDRYMGWRRGFSWPFFPFDRAERRPITTLQMPTAWMDDQMFGLRAHNAHFEGPPLAELMDRVAAQGGCFMTDVHEYVYDAVLYPGWCAEYRTMLERLASTHAVWFATPAEIARHWIARAASLVRDSCGLEAHRLALESRPRPA